jgi:hypothetical protein
MSLKPALIVSDLLALDQAEAGLLIACHLDQRGVVRAQVGAVERQVVPVVMGRVVVVLERAHHAAHSRLEGIHRVDAGVLARAADSEGPAVGKHVDLRGELELHLAAHLDDGEAALEGWRVGAGGRRR